MDANLCGIEPGARDALQRRGAAPGSVASVHFSSQSNEWETPQEFFTRQDFIYQFTLDACATPENAKCRKFYTATDNGLAQSWQGQRVWMNPPYGRAIGVWMKKAFEESQGSALVVCLVPARTDTAWWHDYAAKGQVTFIRGRLKFGRGKNSAPFPSALVVMSPQNSIIMRQCVHGRVHG
jgi:phage N-6-adenine-methyltransferase